MPLCAITETCDCDNRQAVTLHGALPVGYKVSNALAIKIADAVGPIKAVRSIKFLSWALSAKFYCCKC